MLKSKRWTPEARERQASKIKAWKPWQGNASTPHPTHEALSTALAHFLHHDPDDDLQPEST